MDLAIDDRGRQCAEQRRELCRRGLQARDRPEPAWRTDLHQEGLLGRVGAGDREPFQDVDDHEQRQVLGKPVDHPRDR